MKTVNTAFKHPRRLSLRLKTTLQRKRPRRGPPAHGRQPRPRAAASGGWGPQAARPRPQLSPLKSGIKGAPGKGLVRCPGTATEGQGSDAAPVRPS